MLKISLCAKLVTALLTPIPVRQCTVIRLGFQASRLLRSPSARSALSRSFAIASPGLTSMSPPWDDKANAPLAATDEKCKDRKKRRAALVIGYVGSNYSGLQKSEGADDISTIESTLEKALYEAGYIRESNFGSFDKIGWARCSRTDKGVHAARNVVSAKLEFKQSDLEQSYWSETAVQEVNCQLPPDIRVHSCARVTKSFRPRDAVSFRQYEYILPVSLLAPHGTHEYFDVEAAMARFCNLLKKYEGTNNMHNFTKIKSRDFLRTVKNKISGAAPSAPRHSRSQAATDAVSTAMEVDEVEGEDEEAVEADEEEEKTPIFVQEGTQKVEGIRRFNTAVSLNPLFRLLRDTCEPRSINAKAAEGGQQERSKSQNAEDLVIGDPADGITTALWDLSKYHGVIKMVRTNLYVCEGCSMEAEGQKFISISLHGSSFLYNQIRLIIGATAAVVSGLLPEDAIEIALKSPYLVYHPLAPAEGLYLRHITFGRKMKNPVVMLESELPKPEDPLECNYAASSKVYALMDQRAISRADTFERDHILKKVFQSWTPELIEDWRRYASYFALSKEVREQLRGKYRQWRGTMKVLEENKIQRETQRRENMSKWAEVDAEAARDLVRSYRRWMPQRFATDLIIRYRLRPGKQVADIQRALASLMATDKVTGTSNTADLFAVIDGRGGVQELARIGAALFGKAGLSKEDEERSDDAEMDMQ